MPNYQLSKDSTAIVAILLLTMLAGGAHGQTGEWLQLRGDRHMSGRASGIGQIHEPPQERWRYDIAAWEGYVEVVQHGGDASVSLPFAAPVIPGTSAPKGGSGGLGRRFLTSAAARWSCRWITSSKWPRSCPG